MKKTLLVVEDEGELRTLLEALLKSWGFGVVATEGRSAAEAALSLNQNFYLVLTDLKMESPCSGLELLVTVKQRYPAMPVIVSSGDFDEIEGMRAKLEDHGADLLFSKPYKPLELKAALDSFKRPTMCEVLAWFLKTTSEIPSTEYCDEWIAATRELNGCLRAAFGDNPLDQPSETELDAPSHRAFFALQRVAEKWKQ